ncbi:hypothetical protein [Nocardia grenadensis]|uniref:hypothetical protein n=1 Tax=Nocardia grenadensis TaxID=931537 RepID=UPI0007A37738|nr:hypothetical protein [Nocardia grenadensis]
MTDVIAAPAMAIGRPNPAERALFRPDSAAWRVVGDSTDVLGASRRWIIQRPDMTDRVFAVLGSPRPPSFPVLRWALLWNYTMRPITGGADAVITACLLPLVSRELPGVEWGRRAITRLRREAACG